MNSKLLDLYNSKWDKLCLAMKPILEDQTLEIKPTCPLLLSVNDNDYNSGDIRLVVYGQETNSWYSEFHNGIEPIVECYEEFFTNGECWSYGGQFWNGVNRFIELLQEKYPNKKISLIWNNIVKIGKFDDKGFPPDYIYEVEREHFSVIKDELKILKPTIVLFLTGPNYDSVIADNFGNLTYSKLPTDYSEREIAKIGLTGVPFAFRTYHPNYLWRNNINGYFQTIIDKINIYSTDNIFLKPTDQLKDELEKIKTEKEKLISEKNYEQVARLRDSEKMLLEALEFRQ